MKRIFCSFVRIFRMQVDYSTKFCLRSLLTCLCYHFQFCLFPFHLDFFLIEVKMTMRNTSGKASANLTPNQENIMRNQSTLRIPPVLGVISGAINKAKIFPRFYPFSQFLHQSFNTKNKKAFRGRKVTTSSPKLKNLGKGHNSSLKEFATFIFIATKIFCSRLI